MKKFLPEAGFSGRVMRRLAVLLVIALWNMPKKEATK